MKKVMILQLVYLLLFEPFLRCFTRLFKRKNRPDFTSDIVLVTGAAQGLGKEIAVQVSPRQPHPLRLFEVSRNDLHKMTEFDVAEKLVRLMLVWSRA